MSNDSNPVGTRMLYLYGIMDPPVEMYQKIIEQFYCRGSLSFQNLSLLHANFG